MINLNIKEKKKSFRLGFSPFTLLLSACGGNSASTNQSVESVKGAVVKGPLANALVFIDTNADGLLSNGELSVRTDISGEYTLIGSELSGDLIALTDSLTIDQSSGKALEGVVLKAPKGSKVVSPTTTIMSETGMSGSEVMTALGLPSDIDPTQYNPFDDVNDEQVALEYEKASHQIINTVRGIGAALEASGMNSAEAFTKSMDAFVSVVKEKGSENLSIDFTSVSEISEVIDRVVKDNPEVINLSTELKGSITSAINNTNDLISKANDLSSEGSQSLFALSNSVVEQIKSSGGNAEKILFADIDNLTEIVIIDGDDEETATSGVSGGGVSNGGGITVKSFNAPKTQAKILFDIDLLQDEDQNQKSDHIEKLESAFNDAKAQFEQNFVDSFSISTSTWIWENTYFTDSSIVVFEGQSSLENGFNVSGTTRGVEFVFNSAGVSLSDLLDTLKNIETAFSSIDVTNQSKDDFSAVVTAVSSLQNKVFEKVSFWTDVPAPTSDGIISLDASTETVSVSLSEDILQYHANGDLLFQIEGNYQTNWEKVFSNIVSFYDAYDEIDAAGWLANSSISQDNTSVAETPAETTPTTPEPVTPAAQARMVANLSDGNSQLERTDLDVGQPLRNLLDLIDLPTSTSITINPNHETATTISFENSELSISCGDYNLNLGLLAADQNWQNSVDVFYQFLGYFSSTTASADTPSDATDNQNGDSTTTTVNTSSNFFSDDLLDSSEQADLSDLLTGISGPKISLSFKNDLLFEIDGGDLGEILKNELINPNLKLGVVQLDVNDQDVFISDSNELLSVVLENANVNKNSLTDTWQSGLESLNSDIIIGTSDVTDIIELIAREFGSIMEEAILPSDWNTRSPENTATSTTDATTPAVPTAQEYNLSESDYAFII